jgi:putative lipoic acid-binding regulatory protein
VVVRGRLGVRPVVGGAADEALLARVVVVVAAREAEDARVGRARPVDGGRTADHVLVDLRQTQRVQLQRVHQVLLQKSHHTEGEFQVRVATAAISTPDSDSSGGDYV